MNRIINLKLNDLTRLNLLKVNKFNTILVRSYVDKVEIEKEVNSKEAKAKRLQRKKTEKTNVIATNSFKHSSLNKLNYKEVPQLCFGLDRALFNPGITYLQDPHSGVYNFDPYLENIVQPEDVDMSKFPDYTPASQDKDLINYAKTHKLSYTGTTSSITGLLSHLYFIASGWKKPTLTTFSSDFAKMVKSGDYSKTLTTPTTVKLKLKDGIYNIDADKTFDSGPNILNQLGHIMERMLTQTPNELSRYLKENESLYPGPIAEPSAYQYSASSKIAFRAQLDCSDPRLPRKIFDLKTRSTLPIRLDKHYYKEYLGYELNKQYGVMESFEREYYDMIRNAFLKYSLQVRIGKMDGIMVAYHNTAKIFGFQYISLEEMDSKLFGNSVMGNQAFIITVRLLEKILDRITSDFPGKEVMVTFKTKNKSLMMDVFVEVIESKGESESEAEAEALSFISPQSTLVKYQVLAHSLINGKKIEGPVSLDPSGKDVWRVSYDITKSNKDKLQLYEEYVEVRNGQASFYQSNAAVDEFGEIKAPKQLSPLKSLLREISKNNLKENEKFGEVKGRRPTIFQPLKFRKTY